MQRLKALDEILLGMIPACRAFRSSSLPQMAGAVSRMVALGGEPDFHPDLGRLSSNVQPQHSTAVRCSIKASCSCSVSSTGCGNASVMMSCIAASFPHCIRPCIIDINSDTASLSPSHSASKRSASTAAVDWSSCKGETSVYILLCNLVFSAMAQAHEKGQRSKRTIHFQA